MSNLFMKMKAVVILTVLVCGTMAAPVPEGGPLGDLIGQVINVPSRLINSLLGGLFSQNGGYNNGMGGFGGGGGLGALGGLLTAPLSLLGLGGGGGGIFGNPVGAGQQLLQGGMTTGAGFLQSGQNAMQGAMNLPQIISQLPQDLQALLSNSPGNQAAQQQFLQAATMQGIPQNVAMTLLQAVASQGAAGFQQGAGAMQQFMPH